MLRSARTTRIGRTFTLPTIAIIAAACGGEVKDVKDVAGDTTNPVARVTVPGPKDTSTGTVVSYNGPNVLPTAFTLNGTVCRTA